MHGHDLTFPVPADAGPAPRIQVHEVSPMITHTPATLPRRVLYAAVLCGLMTPALGLAQSNLELDLDDPEIAELVEIRSFIEFGLGYVDDDSFRFGRYTGLHKEGGYGVLNIDWYRRAPFDSPDPTYTRLQTRNLGLSSRSASFEHGRQGDYGVRLDYRQIPIYRSESARTIFNGSGGNTLTLPTGWVAAGNTVGMTQLLPSLQPVELRHERRRFGFGLDKLLSDRWGVSTNFRHENKQGIKTNAGLFGNSGGNPRSVLLAEPVDYETREVDVALHYSDRQKQFQVRYLVSLFDDNNSKLTWQNPFSTISGWQPTSGYPAIGELATPPDNQFHQLSLAGGINWGNGMRLTSDLAFGRMTQDEDFLNLTANPVIAQTITQPLPRTSLDGRIDTTVANVRLGARPSHAFHWNASLRYDDRDNRTPRDEYVYIGGDSTVQETAANSSRRRFNMPYSFTETRLKLDAGYRFAPRTQLSGEIERRDTERTYSEREDADETIFGLKLRHASSDWFSTSLQVSRADRSGSTYHGDATFLSTYSPGYVAYRTDAWENPPGFVRFNIADRIRDRVGAGITLTPNAFWSIGLDAQRIEDDYRKSALGLRASDTEMFTFNVSFMPSANWSNHLFYVRENSGMDQYGHSLAATPSVDLTNPARAWAAFHRDKVDTAGAGFKWTADDSRLSLGAEYVYSRTHSQIDVTTGSALTSAPLPADRTRLNSITLNGQYRLRDNLSLKMQLWNERYRSTDFALDNVDPNQLANVILLGEDSPDYKVNVVTFSLVYRFN
jgi:MtrB/PioB family decaheme-associated outer membrane protein